MEDGGCVLIHDWGGRKGAERLKDCAMSAVFHRGSR